MKLGQFRGFTAVATVILMTCLVSQSQDKRKIIIDQDAAGPAGTDQQAILLLIQSRQTEVLGITVVTGDAWLTEEVAHTLRMLELIGRTDIPVVRGAEYPLVRTKEETEQWEQRYGSVAWLGAWTPRVYHAPRELGAMPEGKPTTKAADEDAAHFLVRMVRKYPHEVTIYEGGPMTNLALAISIDTEFASLAKELVFMGASLNPQTADPEFANTPRREFNLWFDPEAAHIVLRAAWPRIDVTTADVSIKAPFSKEMLDAIAKSSTPAARYIAAWSQNRYYMWDELAACAWVEPGLITKEKPLYMDVDLSHGPSYGNTLTWNEALKPATGVRLVHAQIDLDLPRFQKMFVEMMTGTVR